MTIEVRQLLLKSRVSDEEGDDAEGGASRPSSAADEMPQDGCDDREQLKEEILAECRVWLLEQLRQLRER